MDNDCVDDERFDHDRFDHDRFNHDYFADDYFGNDCFADDYFGNDCFGDDCAENSKNSEDAGESRGDAMPTALVTGSAKGIGRALLLALAADGYDVVVHYRSSEDEAEQVAEEARAHPITALTLQADLSDPDQATALVEQTYQRFGRLDVLINNVGNYHKAPLSDVSVDDWHHMFDTNLHSTFYTSGRAVTLMRDAGYGRIINLGYAGAEQLVARPQVTAYSIAKTGVILYSKALAEQEAASGITVNVISPGVMENSVSQPIDDIPLGRAGTLNELVAAARFLWSPDAAYVTGTTIEVAGGWHL